jgi:hypothetical protein
MNKMILRNEEDMVQSEISFLESGKHRVILRDLESDNVLPVVRIYDAFEDALKYARHIIGKEELITH